MFRIGIDVGGTNTDAVIMADRKVIAKFKTPTTEDIETGVVGAMAEILRQYSIAPSSIEAVMIGTTQFTNAFVERRRLMNVGVLRLALPSTEDLPPLTDWPKELRALVQDNVSLVAGGYEYDGQPIHALDEKGVISAVRAMRERGVRSFAISSVFAHVNREMEDRAAKIVRAEVAGAHVTLSADIGRVGLIERENACIMNAMLGDLSHHVVGAFERALCDLSINAPLYISQNDGTLMSAEQVAKYPVLTFASGPTNSMRGAAFLTGLQDCVVIDIGGTTTDVGMLTGGFPRESSISVDIGQVRTNFRMPDVLSIGLGGGSVIVPEPELSVGPGSVGFRLLQEALVFGGSTLTATDIVVAAGHARVGDARAVRDVPAPLVAQCLERFNVMVEEAIDRIKVSSSPAPAVLVGGGAILVTRTLRGVHEHVVPEHADVVNAIGAAIAQVGGQVDLVFPYAEIGREKALDRARSEVYQRVLRAGGEPGSVRIVDIEEIPLAYMPGDAVRVRIKAVAELAQIRADGAA